MTSAGIMTSAAIQPICGLPFGVRGWGGVNAEPFNELFRKLVTAMASKPLTLRSRGLPQPDRGVQIDLMFFVNARRAERSRIDYGTVRHPPVLAEKLAGQGNAVQRRTGGCNCARVRFEVNGPPARSGFCHCLTCRKETGSVGNFFAVWQTANVSITGSTRSWKLTTDHRHFCPSCGSSLFGIVDGSNEVEIYVGSFDDAPSDLIPEYELWVDRRERWLAAVAGAEQHPGNRA